MSFNHSHIYDLFCYLCFSEGWSSSFPIFSLKLIKHAWTIDLCGLTSMRKQIEQSNRVNKLLFYTKQGIL